MDGGNAEFLEGGPIAKGDAGVNERNFDEIVESVLLLRGKIGTKIWNGHVPARKNAAFGARSEDFSAGSIGDDYLLRGLCAVRVLGADDSAVETDTNCICRAIEMVVRNLSSDDIFSGMAGNGIWN
jgi:hypothetical protein